MQKWTYNVIEKQKHDMRAALKECGDNGWELVAVTYYLAKQPVDPAVDSWLLFFKKPVEHAASPKDK